MAASIQTPIGLLCYPHLFVPRPAFEGGEPRYSLCLLFNATAQKTPEFLALRRAVAVAIDEAWGPGKSQDKAFVAKLRSPFRPTQDKDKQGFKTMVGGLYIQPWSKQQPPVVDALVQRIVVPGDVWPGQTARCSVNAFTYDQAGNKGVSFGLNNVQIADTSGPRLDGRKAPEEEFSPIANDNAELALAGNDDEPPF